MCAQITFMYSVLTECTNTCDVGQNISNTKKTAINRLTENKNRSQSKLCERVNSLDFSIEETYEEKQ